MVLVEVRAEGPIRYPEYQIRLHDVSRLSPPAHQSDKGQLLLSVRCQGDTKYHSILTSLAGADIEINRGGEGGREGRCCYHPDHLVSTVLSVLSVDCGHYGHPHESHAMVMPEC